MTVNRFCSSGLQAIAIAADRIRLGEADVVVAGGTESMSMIPMGGNKISLSPQIFERDENVAIGYGMGITAELVARQWGISREAQDEFAVASHRKAMVAMQAGDFDDEIVPYTVCLREADLDSHTSRLSTRECSVDEGPRAETSMEVLATLKPAFAAGGSVTAGNSSQMSDGAAAVVLASAEAVKRFSLQPLARFVGFAVAGVPPQVMGIGPKVAIPKVLEQCDLKLSELDWIELNEAFAAQCLALISDLQLDPALINPLGGAIALGHPLGATGAIRAATLIHGLRRRRKRYGMVTMCVGTGMGAAGVFEAL
jgi:acetyl-CoA acyltransferase